MKAKWIAFAAAGVLASLSLAPAAMAQAAGGSPVQLVNSVKVDKQVTENGKVKHVWVDPNVVVPGDKLFYTISYRNSSAEAVQNFDLSNPLAAGVMLDGDGADALTVSVDGGKTWGKLSALRVVDGGVARPAQAADVTHLRWVLPLIAAGASGTLTYHAIVR